MEERNTANEKPWEVYVLRCADGTLYTGIAKSAEARCKVHNEGRGAKYTRSRLPVSVVYTERGFGYGEALKRELEIKKLPRKDKLSLIGSTASVAERKD